MAGRQQRVANVTDAGRMNRMNPTIAVAELAESLRGEMPPVLLDVRWRLGGPPGIEAYRDGHLPGACYVDLDRELSGPPGIQGRHPLPDPEDFAGTMRRCGVSAGRDVVVYDESDGTAAARAWWLLRYFGHRRTRLLDGGYRAWVSAGQQVSTEMPTPAAGDFGARPGGMPVLTAESAAEVAAHGVLLDARAAERYRGEVEPVDPVAGHIPGAVSAPTVQNVAAGGGFRRAEELRARFAGLGVGDAPAVGVYCGSGVTAAHQVLALELAGFTAALYPGSWSHWVTDPARPVATGRAGSQNMPLRSGQAEQPQQDSAHR
jgi:thiosulfate/3-mercaptopyruvate sulfurtransferase